MHPSHASSFCLFFLYFFRAFRVFRGESYLSLHRDAHQVFDLLGHMFQPKRSSSLSWPFCPRAGQVGSIQNAFDAPDEALLGGIDEHLSLLVRAIPARRGAWRRPGAAAQAAWIGHHGVDSRPGTATMSADSINSVSLDRPRCRRSGWRDPAADSAK